MTGGGAGLGAACSRALAAAGAEVTVLDVDEDSARRVAEEVGGTAWAVNLLDTGALTSLEVDTDILVNNAGIQVVAPIQEFDPADFLRIQALMVTAPFLLIRAALPGMYRRGFGRIINMSSIHGLHASEFKVAYVAAKHGLEGLSKVTAREGGPHGVTSNCVNPGYVHTALVDGQIADQAATHRLEPEEVLQKVLLERSAIKRLIEPEEVAGLVTWLASDAAEMVSGASYVMDGGWSA